MVNLENGAVNVLAADPAIPPHKSCFTASDVLESFIGDAGFSLCLPLSFFSVLVTSAFVLLLILS